MFESYLIKKIVNVWQGDEDGSTNIYCGIWDYTSNIMLCLFGAFFFLSLLRNTYAPALIG